MVSIEGIKQKLPEIKYKTRVTVRKAKYLFKHRKEVYGKLTSKLDKKAYGVSTFMAVASGQVLPPLNTGITLMVDQLLNNKENITLGIYSLGIIALISNLQSLYTETKTLNEKKYSNSPITTLLFRYLDKKNLNSFKILKKFNNTEIAAFTSALVSHGYHFLLLGVLNPANIQAVINFVRGDPAAALVIEGLLTVSTTNAIYNILTESRILKGDDEKIIETIKKVPRKTGDILFGNPIKSLII